MGRGAATVGAGAGLARRSGAWLNFIFSPFQEPGAMRQPAAVDPSTDLKAWTRLQAGIRELAGDLRTAWDPITSQDSITAGIRVPTGIREQPGTRLLAEIRLQPASEYRQGIRERPGIRLPAGIPSTAGTRVPRGSLSLTGLPALCRIRLPRNPLVCHRGIMTSNLIISLLCAMDIPRQTKSLEGHPQQNPIQQADTIPNLDTKAHEALQKFQT
ncbi:hypothetical protein O3P69_004951 [Scylla paramamosain]|uniref:Uncharacterized protein n=1 Tax=Scylla paramamosain TaxID=85552 RepID=A0AAW0U951_SCYPA